MLKILFYVPENLIAYYCLINFDIHFYLTKKNTFTTATVKIINFKLVII